MDGGREGKMDIIITIFIIIGALFAEVTAVINVVVVQHSGEELNIVSKKIHGLIPVQTIQCGVSCSLCAYIGFPPNPNSYKEFSLKKII